MDNKSRNNWIYLIAGIAIGAIVKITKDAFSAISKEDNDVATFDEEPTDFISAEAIDDEYE